MSFIGTIRPLVQRSSPRQAAKLLASVGIPFAASAVLVFALAWLVVGAAARHAPMPIRLALVACAAGAAVAVDLRSAAAGQWCPVGASRQTPKALATRARTTVTLAFWGFDTGTAVTTFRVSAATWVIMVAAAMRVAPWWIGGGYALAFVGPMALCLVRRQVGAQEAGGTMQHEVRLVHWFRRAQPSLQRACALCAIAVVAGVGLAACESRDPKERAAAACRVTVIPPQDRLPDKVKAMAQGTPLYGDGDLYVNVPTLDGGAGPQRQPDGALAFKVGWLRAAEGEVRVSATAVDGTERVSERAFGQPGAKGFLATTVVVPRAGCWRVTGRLNQSIVAFVTRVPEPSSPAG